jgi:hypothetical protein
MKQNQSNNYTYDKEYFNDNSDSRLGYDELLLGIVADTQKESWNKVKLTVSIDER